MRLGEPSFGLRQRSGVCEQEDRSLVGTWEKDFTGEVNEGLSP